MEPTKTRTSTASLMSAMLTTMLGALAALAAGSMPVGAAPAAKAVLIGTFDSPVYIAVAPGQSRLLFVVESLGFRDVHLGISGAFFVALSASLLTAIPLTPAGLGLVELGVVGILTVIYGVDATNATAITLVDRAISVFSIWIFGSIAYVLSPMTRSGSRRSADLDGAPGSLSVK